MAPIDTYDAVVVGSGEAVKLWRTSWLYSIAKVSGIV
jgi:hypothetical protein